MLNFVVIMSDSFRRDHLGAYGNRWIRTPSLDEFARRATLFDRFYAASFPTIPNRSDCFTGRYTFLDRGWTKIPGGVKVMSQYFSEAGYVTQLINDTPHLMNQGSNFDRGFDGWEWVRGQEIDRFMTVANAKIRLPAAREKLRFDGRSTDRHLRNNYFRQFESDWTTAQVVNKACQWLEYNYKAPKFLLWLDIFDPHESWDPPPWFVDFYYPGYKGDRVITPIYGPVGDISKDEIRYVRAAYAGEVTFVDKYVGWLLRKLEDLRLLDRTAVIFCTDHGYYHGEHGLFGKSNRAGPFPFYEEIVHIPLMIMLPGKRARARTGALAQPPDLLPTMMDLAGLKIAPEIQGRSLKNILLGRGDGGRKLAPMSSGLHDDELVKARRLTLTTRSHSMLMGPEGARPELYDLRKDPAQKHNIFNRNKDAARRIQNSFRAWLAEMDFDPSRIDWIAF